MNGDVSNQAKQNAKLSAEGRSVLIALENDWRRMSGNEDPLRPARLDPTKMHEALPYTFLLTRDATGNGRIRVAGQLLHDMLGTDPRGMSLCAFFKEKAAAEIVRLMEICVTMPAIISVPLIASRSFGRTAPAEMLLLPMRDVDRRMTRIIGGIVTECHWRGKTAKLDQDSDVEIRCEKLDGAFPDRRRADRDTSHAATPPHQHVAAAIHGLDVAGKVGEAKEADGPTARPKLRLIVDNN